MTVYPQQVQLPVSKSLCIRRLIYDFCCFDRLGDIPSDAPSDVCVLHCALRLVQESKNGESPSEPVLIDVHDCGAAYRFLMALLAVTQGQWLLTGTGRLLQRPIEELVQCLQSIGADIQWIPDDDNVVSCKNGVVSCRDALRRVFARKSACWLIHGKNLHAPDLTIDCTRSGQFASALLLIGDKIGLKNLHIQPEHPSSFSYIEMTRAVVNGSIKLEDNRMADWSAAVYWYARLLLSHHIARKTACKNSFEIHAPDSYKLMNLDLASLQADAIVASWFAQWGVRSFQERDGVRIVHDKSIDCQFDELELDVSQNLDQVPVLACMACLWPKKMVLNGVANLKYKESNRLQIIQEQLSAFADIKLNTYNGIVDNQLVVNPRRDRACHVSTICSNENDPNCTGVDFVFDAHNDHRFVMGFSLFALCGEVCIKGFGCVRKSYPNFHAEGVIAGTDVLGQNLDDILVFS